jgi:2-alkenal reductase
MLPDDPAQPTPAASPTPAPIPPRRSPRSVVLTAAAAGLALAAVGGAAFSPLGANPTDQAFAAPDGSTTAKTGLFGQDCPETLSQPTLLGISLQTDAGTSDAGTLSVADVAERANPAVVTVTNRAAPDSGLLPSDVFPGGDETVPVGAGSGFIIDAEGHVVTNNHVVAGADELEVQFFDGTETMATVVGRDEVQDVAVLQLDLADGREVPGILAFGDSDAVRAGEDVVAIGSSLGEFTNTVSRGIVGNVDRSLGGLPNLIQHDAPIYPGNSGGPLLNLAGEVIGINVAGVGNIRQGATPAQLAFAINSNAARAVVEELIANGVVRRPWLGISGAPIDGGQFVDEVLPDTPAAAAGVQADDLIVAIDGERLDGNTGLIEILSAREPGETVTLTIERDGDEQELDVTLGERPAETD